MRCEGQLVPGNVLLMIHEASDRYTAVYYAQLIPPADLHYYECAVYFFCSTLLASYLSMVKEEAENRNNIINVKVNHLDLEETIILRNLGQRLGCSCTKIIVIYMILQLTAAAAVLYVEWIRRTYSVFL